MEEVFHTNGRELVTISYVEAVISLWSTAWMPKVYGKGQISGFLGDPDNMLDLVSNHAATTYWKTFLVNIFRCLLMLLNLLNENDRYPQTWL